MLILEMLGICYFTSEQGSLKSKPTFQYSSNNNFKLPFSETKYHKGGPSNLMTYIDNLEPDLWSNLCRSVA